MRKNKNPFFQIISLIILLFLIYLQISAIQDFTENPNDKKTLISLIAYSSLLLIFIILSSLLSNRKRKKHNLYGQPIEDDGDAEERTEIFDTFQQKQLMTKYEERILDLRPLKKPLLTQCPNCKFLITANMKKCPNCGYSNN